MSKKDYKGWTLFDNVTIISRDEQDYHKSGFPQAYVADSSNKQQLTTGREWGNWSHGSWKTNPETGKEEWVKVTHDYLEEQFENEGFTLSLLDCAEQSSQGGKLSFWNCLVTKDGKGWVIGIAANLLLDVLKNCTVIDGTVQEPLIFARCLGGVGMLSKNMPAYKQAVSDMERKKSMSRGKTSKYELGRVYETTTLQNVYLGTFYQWYEPVEGQDKSKYYYTLTTIGYKKLDKPKVVHMFPAYESQLTNASDYLGRCRSFVDKKPARVCLEGAQVNMDLTSEELVEQMVQKHLVDYITEKKNNHTWYYIDSDLVGLSASDKEYELLPQVFKLLKDEGYNIYAADF